MQVRQFRHRMPHGIIESAALGDVTAFDVRSRDTHLGARYTRGKCFEAICVNDYPVRSNFCEDLGEIKHTTADRSRGRQQIVTTHLDLHLAVGAEPVMRDLVGGIPKVLIQVRTRDEEVELQIGMLGDRFDDG
jgi:hypothetical protein